MVDQQLPAIHGRKDPNPDSGMKFLQIVRIFADIKKMPILQKI